MLTPLPFQLDARDFFLEGDHADWSEPGTGKTLGAALAAKSVGGVGVVCAPANAVDQWTRVLKSLDIDAVAFRKGTEKGAVKVTSWGLLGKGILADDASYDFFIPDEAHKAVRTRALRTRSMIDLAERCGAVWPLTGTPILRYADDLWPICSALWPAHLDALGIRSESMFINRFCYVQNDVVMGSRRTALRSLYKILYGRGSLEPVVMSRTMEEVAPHLPDMLEPRQFTIHLDAKEREEINETLSTEMLDMLEAARDVADDPDGHIASARRALGMIKAHEAAALVSEAPRKVIAAYWHKAVGDLLEGAINAKRSLIRLDGSTPGPKRQSLIDRFNDPNGPDVLLLQMQAGGEAVNPHENCSHLIFCERDWSGAVMDQAMRRVRRIGQGAPQQIDYLDADHPLDYAMARTARRKYNDLGVLKNGM